MNQIEIYTTLENQIEILVNLEKETVWLNRNQISLLFNRDIKTISKHINNIFKEEELDYNSVVAKNATTGNDGKTYQVEYFNLDVIISIGYRVKSKEGTKFRIWANNIIKKYLIDGYSLNNKLLKNENDKLKSLKKSISILNRLIENSELNFYNLNKIYKSGLKLLDKYDHKNLDVKGKSEYLTKYPDLNEYLIIIDEMKKDVSSDLFGKQKDRSFEGSINQIKQSFDKIDLYPTLEEKAATLLYSIVKNHSFIDGNKRIAAACFVYFLEQNNMLYNQENELKISNETLATLTLFIAVSNPNEIEDVKNLIISLLNL